MCVHLCFCVCACVLSLCLFLCVCQCIYLYIYILCEYENMSLVLVNKRLCMSCVCMGVRESVFVNLPVLLCSSINSVPSVYDNVCLFFIYTIFTSLCVFVFFHVF